MKIPAPGLGDLDRMGDEFAGRVHAAVVHVAGRARAHLQARATVTVDDVAAIPTWWANAVDDTLVSHIAAAYWHGVNHVTAPVAARFTPARSLRADALDVTGELDDPGDAALDDVPFDLPRVTSPAAEQRLINARNRLVGVGNIVWEEARGALVEGVANGEGIAALAARVFTASGLASPRAEVIARTEVNGAANAGAIDQIRAYDVPATKQWVATMDERTRPDHAEADGQEVGLDEQFDIGGEYLDRPHDDTADPAQTINCRCTVTFSIPDDQIDGLDPGMSGDEGDGEGLTAAGKPFDGTPEIDPAGVILALLPTPEHAARLAVPGGHEPDQLHCTLAFLGDAADYSEQERASIIAAVRGHAPPPVAARAFGVNHWNADTNPKWVFGVGNDQDDDTPNDQGADDSARTSTLTDARAAALRAVGSAEMPHKMPAQHEPWMPHVTVAHGDVAVFDDMIKRLGPVRFDTIRVAFGDQVTDIAMDTSPDGHTDVTEQGDDMTAATASALLADGAETGPPEWRGILIVEGTPTGDGRLFAANAVGWPNPGDVPMALQWQKETNHGSDHDVTVSVGRIDRVWRDGVNIVGEGRWDTHPDALEARRRCDEGFLNGVSINADDITDADVEYVFPDSGEESDDEDDILSMLFAQPEQIIFHAARLRAVTLCDIPAYVEAQIHTVDTADALVASAGVLEAVAEYMPSQLATVTERTPAGFDTWTPPAAWFRDPELKVATPIIVTDAGRVYGLVSEWGECHIGFGDQCVLPPKESYHDRFMTGSLRLDDGTTIAVGQITAGIGHADLSMTAAAAAEHYDNTDAVVADVQIGNSKVGIWVAGAIRPWADPARVHALRASGQVSPDWRDIGGQLRMVGLLTVNVSGFQVPRVRELVAGGRVMSRITSGMVSVRNPAPPAVTKEAWDAYRDKLRRKVHGDN